MGKPHIEDRNGTPTIDLRAAVTGALFVMVSDWLTERGLDGGINFDVVPFDWAKGGGSQRGLVVRIRIEQGRELPTLQLGHVVDLWALSEMSLDPVKTVVEDVRRKLPKARPDGVRVRSMLAGQLMEAQAKFLESIEWWKTMPNREVALLQIQQPRMCMPMSTFHTTLELALGRSVAPQEYTYGPEFLVNELKRMGGRVR